MNESLNEFSTEITSATFENWSRRARPGDQFIYHIGFLAADREEVRYLQAPYNAYAHVFFEPIHSLGQTVWRAYEDGKVELIQRRVGDRHRQTFHYIAVKRKIQKRKRR